MSTPDEFRCAFCRQPAAIIRSGGLSHLIECKRCGNYWVGAIFRQLIRNGTEVAKSYLVSGHIRNLKERGEEPPRFNDFDTCEHLANSIVVSFRDQADVILAAAQRRSPHFGAHVRFVPDDDYPIGYARNKSEFVALVDYLIKKSFLKQDSNTSAGIDVIVTAEGIDALESQLLLPQLIVFLSSTCFDLLDLRSELASFFESKGYIVRLSEDWERFDVGGLDNSIETCLQNLGDSDVVVCILDRRYGGVVKAGKFEGYSATHMEVLRAREAKKPIFFFIRSRAENEFRQVRQNAQYSTEWIEKDPARRTKWMELARLAFELPTGEEYSNWKDQFESVVDLKKIALKRLTDYRNRLSQRP